MHRDLKTQNVMVRRDGTVKILDFGLVKVLSDGRPLADDDGRRVRQHPLRLARAPLGAWRAGLRSDLYALGCLLHHMLVGTPPFSTDQPALLASQHLTATPPSVDVPVPAALQELVTSSTGWTVPASRPWTRTTPLQAPCRQEPPVPVEVRGRSVQCMGIPCRVRELPRFRARSAAHRTPEAFVQPPLRVMAC
ncbi:MULTISPECIES: protein kinase domain-containing protein [Streptomyces]|uniref:protein kinase domain-containing protein n=1 Tax=Streptomyces TaxID=1883 RepID=UPI00332F355E